MLNVASQRITDLANSAYQTWLREWHYAETSILQYCAMITVTLDVHNESTVNCLQKLKI